MNRFLRYSLEKNQKIRAVLINEDGAMTQLNLTVTALDETSFTFLSAKNKTPRTLPLASLLSAGYARGDKGE